MIEKKEIGMCPLCGTKYDLSHTFCGNDGNQLEQRTLLTYNGSEFTKYQDLYNFLIKSHVKSKIDNFNELNNSIKSEIREEKKRDLIEYWKTLNTTFKESYDVPPLPKEDYYEEYVVPALVRCGAIPKNELKDRHYYYGNYRNSNVGMWMEDENKFEIYRNSFGKFYPDQCNHFEDDDNFALFVPIKEVTEEDYNKTK